MLVQLKTKNAISVMDGRTSKEKTINYYLTGLFISQTEAASDECLTYAQMFVKNKYTPEQIAFILFSNFGLGFSQEGDLAYINDSKTFDLAAHHIHLLLSSKE